MITPVDRIRLGFRRYRLNSLRKGNQLAEKVAGQSAQ